VKNDIKDLVIIGGGPAGLSAAVYGKRAMLDEVVIEKDIYAGGQIAVTDRVDNYLGLYGVNGYDLSEKFKEHARQLEVPFLEGEVLNIEDVDGIKKLILDSGDKIFAKAVFIATGAAHRKLGCKGEEKFMGAGVSYCATCDGAFFKNKTVAVVGGGDVALGDAIYLSNICKRVYLIHRRDELRGAKVLGKKIEKTDNIEFLPSCEIEEISGDGTVEKILVKDKRSNNIKAIDVDGVFIAVGMKPNTDLVSGLVETDEGGYIVADESCRSSQNGIYAVGDVRTKELRQVVTAVADGAVAIATLEKDLVRKI
jgi:thioredoxin reductase (NADPH)